LRKSATQQLAKKTSQFGQVIFGHGSNIALKFAIGYTISIPGRRTTTPQSFNEVERKVQTAVCKERREISG